MKNEWACLTVYDPHKDKHKKSIVRVKERFFYLNNWWFSFTLGAAPYDYYLAHWVTGFVGDFRFFKMSEKSLVERYKINIEQFSMALIKIIQSRLPFKKCKHCGSVAIKSRVTLLPLWVCENEKCHSFSGIGKLFYNGERIIGEKINGK